jgi:formamidopyrimidine-DNA glycosylase
MPEGPEVTIMKDELKIFNNACITDIIVHLKRFNVLNLKKCINSLPLKIKEINNKGKFVYIILSNDMVLGFTPGMTGHFWLEKSLLTLTKNGYVYNSKYNYITFHTTKGIFYFNDPRQFGHFYIYDKQELEKKLNTLGPDFIKDLPKMSQSDFNILLSKYDSKVLADILLNQSFISGIGNMYRAEVMYIAKLSPLRTIKSLNMNDKKRLKNALVYIGQNSLKKYKETVYGNPLADKLIRKGRTIYWYSNVQQ